MIHRRGGVHGGWAMVAACDVNEHQFRGVKCTIIIDDAARHRVKYHA
jgi:hypothetical protein